MTDKQRKEVTYLFKALVIAYKNGVSDGKSTSLSTDKKEIEGVLAATVKVVGNVAQLEKDIDKKTQPEIDKK